MWIKRVLAVAGLVALAGCASGRTPTDSICWDPERAQYLCPADPGRK